MRTPRAAAPRRRREYVYDSDADSGNEEGLLPAADVPPPEDEAQLRARARVLFAEISMLTDGRDKHYKSDVRRASAARVGRRSKWIAGAGHGGATAATWIFQGRVADMPRAGRGGAAAAAWMF